MFGEQGLLGAFDMSDPRKQALMGFAGGLLQGGSASQEPLTLGRVMAPAFSGAAQGFNKGIMGAAELARAQRTGMKGDKPALVQEYEYAVANGYKGTLMEFMAAKRGGAGEYGMTPLWGTKDGKPVAIQLGKSGEAVESKLPEGVELQSNKVQMLDAGTHFIPYDPLTRTMGNPVEKKNREAAQETAEGRVAGENKAKLLFDLPTTTMQTETTLGRINELRNHPGKNVSLGMIQGRIPPVGGAQADFIERLEQLKGDAFLDAYATLKGGGAITEAEGLKAAASRLRSGRIKDKADFDAALTDYFTFLQRGLETVHKKVGSTWNMPQHLSGSMIGRPGETIIDGGSNIPPPPAGFRIVE